MAADSISVVKVNVSRHQNVGRIEVGGDDRQDGAVGVGPFQAVHSFAGEPEGLEVGGAFEGAVGAFAEEDVFGVGLLVGLVVGGVEVGLHVDVQTQFLFDGSYEGLLRRFAALLVRGGEFKFAAEVGARVLASLQTKVFSLVANDGADFEFWGFRAHAFHHVIFLYFDVESSWGRE